MNRSKSLLIEIGCEELPPQSLSTLIHAFATAMEQQLQKNAISFDHIKSYATPRRLALIIHELATQQPSRKIQRKGPARQAAFDAKGQPTPACIGFAQSCGVSVDALQTIKTDKGEWLFYEAEQPGLETKSLLPELIKSALKQLPIARPMRWGDHRFEFARPVRWMVLLFGQDIVSANLLGISSSNQTYGHRFHHPQAIMLTSADNYEKSLLETGFVMADFAKRREYIHQDIIKVAKEKNASALIDDDLLEEVTSIVEWPVALVGKFSNDFLAVPKEALMVSMKQHQKCFPLEDAEQRLLPYFVMISNIKSKQPDSVIKGNEKVMRARLSDAAFFYDQDRKTPLFDRLKKLDNIIYQKKLGSLGDKVRRMLHLAQYIAEQLNQPQSAVERAILLSKCDLTTEMVGEFPELQGIMGKYYAIHNHEDANVATAIEEHYLPRFSGDKLPSHAIGNIVALVDRIDTLVGIFSIGQKPTGDKDPYGLRRCALGVLRILIENHYDLDLYELLRISLLSFNKTSSATESTINDVAEFIWERLKAWYHEQDLKAEVFYAVKAINPTSPYDFSLRVNAVKYFVTLPQAHDLAAANKRVANILSKAPALEQTQLNLEKMPEAAERDLAELVLAKQKVIHSALQQRDYQTILEELTHLRDAVDAFFDNVMVMVDDEALRNNRLRLLNALRQLFLNVADISYLQGL